MVMEKSTRPKNMLMAKVSIRGKRPLLWHAFNVETFGEGGAGKRKAKDEGSAGNSPEEWKKTVLYTSDWQLYIPPTYVFSCLCAGAKHTKKGKGSIEPVVAATLQVLDEEVLIDRVLPDGLASLPTDPKALVYLYVCGVKNPATKARNVRYRVAASPGWKAEFHIMWDGTLVSRGEMQSAAIDAGNLSGLGDGRKIGFGRFEVESFEMLDD